MTETIPAPRVICICGRHLRWTAGMTNSPHQVCELCYQSRDKCDCTPMGAKP